MDSVGHFVWDAGALGAAILHGRLSEYMGRWRERRAMKKALEEAAPEFELAVSNNKVKAQIARDDATRAEPVLSALEPTVAPASVPVKKAKPRPVVVEDDDERPAPLITPLAVTPIKRSERAQKEKQRSLFEPAEPGAPTGQLPALALLDQPVLARIATAQAKSLQPHVVPVWFLWDGDNLWISAFSSTRKLKDLASNPRCAVLIELPSAYDMVFGLDVFEHLNPNRLDAYVRRIAEITRDGGFLFCNIPAFGKDPVFGTLFPLYVDGWEQDAAAGRPFSTLHVDDEGYPIHGHLVWADARWWVQRFEAAGFGRLPQIERWLASGPF